MNTEVAGWIRWKGEMRGSFSFTLWGNNIIFTIGKSRKCCSPTQNNLKHWFSCTSSLWLLQGWTWAYKVLPGRRDKSCSVLSNVLHTYLSFWLWSEIWEHMSEVTALATYIFFFHTSISWHFCGTSILLTWLPVPGSDLREHSRLAKYTEYQFTLDDF